MDSLTYYRGKRVLVTGNTGFKGSWLCAWLSELGAEVYGLALPPESSPNHWDLLSLSVNSVYGDIADTKLVADAVANANPEIIFHLAAQPLVRRSYSDPVTTWKTNVLGTANLLDAARQAPDLSGIVVVTSDKCYENNEWVWGYRETDTLGGHDPYSASKAATELVAQSYRRAFFNLETSPQIATARGGNVIGGGDWSEDRLVPDLVRAIVAGRQLQIRSPKSTRPWQHVLDCLSGYLMLGHRLTAGDKHFSDAWNFGPGTQANRSVEEVLTHFKRRWGAATWGLSSTPKPHEAQLLYLDASKARHQLGWTPLWDFDTTINATVDWYAAWLDTAAVTTFEQIRLYSAELNRRSGASIG